MKWWKTLAAFEHVQSVWGHSKTPRKIQLFKSWNNLCWKWHHLVHPSDQSRISFKARSISCAWVPTLDTVLQLCSHRSQTGGLTTSLQLLEALQIMQPRILSEFLQLPVSPKTQEDLEQWHSLWDSSWWEPAWNGRWPKQDYRPDFVIRNYKLPSCSNLCPELLLMWFLSLSPFPFPSC